MENPLWRPQRIDRQVAHDQMGALETAPQDLRVDVRCVDCLIHRLGGERGEFHLAARFDRGAAACGQRLTACPLQHVDPGAGGGVGHMVNRPLHLDPDKVPAVTGECGFNRRGGDRGCERVVTGRQCETTSLRDPAANLVTHYR